jgi:chromosomal replication initiation ATPase DnaA
MIDHRGLEDYTTAELLNELRRRCVGTDPREARINEIIYLVSEVCSVSPGAVRSLSRRRDIVTARRIAVVEILREFPGSSLRALADAVHATDHGTAFHSLKRYREEFEKSEEFRLLAERSQAACEATRTLTE